MQLEKAGDVDGLVELLLDDDPGVRRHVVEALSALGANQAIDLMTLLLEDEHYGVRVVTARCLMKLGWSPRGSDAEPAFYATAEHWDGCVRLGTRAVPALIRATGAPLAEQRAGATRALGAIGAEEARMVLVVLLWDPSPEVRKAAVGALESYADEMIVKELARLLRDECFSVRLVTARLLLRLYTSDGLDLGVKDRIRACRRAITQPHYDERRMVRTRDPRTGERRYEVEREDFGIGLEWPEE